MKKNFLFLFFLLIQTLSSQSQARFEKGYYVNDLGETIECLIKNMEWLLNPTDIEIKHSTDANSQQLEINDIREFRVANYKFIKAEVKIDKTNYSSDDKSHLNSNRNPDFMNELLFLKVLVEGNASLYSYKGETYQRFFYKVFDSKISQLVYRQYFYDNSRIITNKTYLQQLSRDLRCESMMKLNMHNLKYSIKSLVKRFSSFNRCNGSAFEVFSKDKQKILDLVHLRLKPSITISNLNIDYEHAADYGDVNLSGNIGYSLGLDFEFTLPYNNRRWAIFVEPTFQNASAKRDFIYQQTELTTITGDLEIDYKLFEIPFGVRNYFYLNKKNSKFYLEAAFVNDLKSKSEIHYIINYTNNSLHKIDIVTANYLRFGAGFNYMNKINLEINYGLKHNIAEGRRNWEVQYSVLTFKFAYKIF